MDTARVEPETERENQYGETIERMEAGCYEQASV